jgi:hypothetical protein
MKQGVPEVNLRSISDGSSMYLLEDNQILKDKLEDKSLPNKTFTTVEVGDEGFSAPVMMYLPNNLG